MSTLSSRYRWILDVLFAGALLGWVVQIPVLIANEGPLRLAPLIALSSVTAVAIALWVAVLRRRFDPSHARSILFWRAGLIVFVANSVVGALASNGTIGSAVLWIAFVVLVLEFGVRVTLVSVAVTSAVIGVSVALTFGDPMGALIEAFGFALFSLVPVGLGALIAAAERARRELQATIVERDDALDDLRAAHAELERRSAVERELTLARERERAARDLHDGLGHRLTVGAMSLEFALRVRDRDADTAWSEVQRAHEGMHDTVAWLRRWVRALDPIADPETAGAEAFEAIADAFRGTGLDVDVRVTGDERAVDRDAALLASRILQEGLTNTLRAGTATRVELHASYEPAGLRLRLLDNGVRLDGDLADPPEGFGRRALRERAESLGGTLSSGWTPRGWLLEATIPAATATGHPETGGGDAANTARSAGVTPLHRLEVATGA